MGSVLVGDCRDVLPTLGAGSVQCVVTSPPYYGLRDYQHPDQIGLEPSVEAYVAEMVAVFRAVRRVLADDGTLWLNLGDSYSGGRSTGANGWKSGSIGAFSDAARGAPLGKRGDGIGPKQLLGVPWRVVFALQADGWVLRSDIIWHKRSPLPESVRDRPTKSHEYLFLLAKRARYFYDASAIAEVAVSGRDLGILRSAKIANANGVAPPIPSIASRRAAGVDSTTAGSGWRNKRTVWTIPPQPCKEAHFAVMPPALVEPCILAGSRPGDTVLDPFLGAGTVGMVASRLGRDWVGIEINPEYAAMAERRVRDDAPLLAEVANGG